jgi:hypothetical protein
LLAFSLSYVPTYDLPTEDVNVEVKIIIAASDKGF